MKTVEFHGLTFEVPDWARWIAQNSGGRIIAFAHKPNRGEDAWYSMGACVILNEPSAPMVIKEIK